MTWARRRPSLLLGALVVAACAACGGTSPQIKVLAVSSTMAHRERPAPGKLVVFVEVVNPTPRNLQLSRLSYRLAADSWFTTEGELALSRPLDAEAAAILEIPVPYRLAPATRPIGYTLQGRLFAVDEQIERSWNLNVSGNLAAASLPAEMSQDQEGRDEPQIRVRIAAPHPGEVLSGGAEQGRR